MFDNEPIIKTDSITQGSSWELYGIKEINSIGRTNMGLRQTIAPYSPIAKSILTIASVALISYGVYDAATLATLIGTLTGVATAFWQGVDVYEANKNK